MHTRKEDGTMTRVLLKDRLAHKLTRAIASGLYPVGTLLPGEMELMKREGVSRFTVRAALAQLERHGLIPPDAACRDARDQPRFHPGLWAAALNALGSRPPRVE